MVLGYEHWKILLTARDNFSLISWNWAAGTEYAKFNNNLINKKRTDIRYKWRKNETIKRYQDPESNKDSSERQLVA